MKRLLALLLTGLVLSFTAVATAETVAPPTPAPAQSATPEEILQQWLQLGDLLRQYGNYPFVELRKGDTGNEVIALQTRLAALGYYKKAVSDNFGSGTYSALKAFEKANGVKADGIASVADQQLLFSDQAVAYTPGSGSSGGSSDGSSSGSSGGSSGGRDATSGATK